MRDFLRRAGRDDGTAAAAALRAKVDDIVSTLNDVEIVFDDDDRVTRIDKLVQDLDQAVDIRDVQAGGRLIEDIDSLPGVAAGQFIGQLDALRFAAGQRRGGLPAKSAICGQFSGCWRRKRRLPPPSYPTHRKYSCPCT